MDSLITLSPPELELLSNEQLFILKSKLQQKISGLFSLLSNEIDEELLAFQNKIPEEVMHSSPKISRGENYLGFPWMVLDHPRMFNKNDVFAFRSLCWWGHEFSFTLHLGGCYCELIKTNLMEFLSRVNGSDTYICISDSPWNYFFEESNYISVADFIAQEKNIKDWASHRNFIKVSKKVSLGHYENIPESGRTFMRLLLSNLAANKS